MLKQFLQLEIKLTQCLSQEATLKSVSVHNRCELSTYAGEDTSVGHLSHWCGWPDE